jgi:hypothetical protein
VSNDSSTFDQTVIFSMWCGYCQRDIPAVADSAKNEIRCIGCGNTLALNLFQGAHKRTSTQAEARHQAHGNSAPTLVTPVDVDSPDDRVRFIEVTEPSETLPQLNVLGEKIWRIDSAHKTRSRSHVLDNDTDKGANPMMSDQGKAPLEKSWIEPEPSLKPPSVSLAIRFAIAVIFLGSCLSLWSMAAGHFTGWLTGQLMTFAGIGLSLTALGHHFNRISRMVIQCKKQIQQLSNSR